MPLMEEKKRKTASWLQKEERNLDIKYIDNSFIFIRNIKNDEINRRYLSLSLTDGSKITLILQHQPLHDNLINCIKKNNNRCKI